MSSARPQTATDPKNEVNMSYEHLTRLIALIEQEHENLLASWRAQIKLLPSAAHLDLPTLNDHMPALLTELVAAFRDASDETITQAVKARSPVQHGKQRAENAFDIEEIVAEYNILRGCLHDLADANGVVMQGRPFHIMNRVLDSAIGVALQAYSTQRALEIQQRREEYLAFVAHDLRTPLSAISMAARALELGLPVPVAAATNQMLKALKRNTGQLETLVTKVLAENTNLKTETGLRLERRHVDLWSLVETLIHDLHPVAGTSSTHLVNKIPDETVVLADASLLRRIFQNLIANAIRYTPRGSVVISARALDDKSVECTVSDDGAGIPADFLERIFDKGETGIDETGTGLGLAIVKTFAEAHGGTVHVESTEGKGSTFRFTLPAASCDSGAPSRVAADNR